jgi:hypothetical protein
VGVYSYPEVNVVTVVYTAEVIGGAIACSQEALEIKTFAPEQIPWEELSFRSTEDALKDYIKKRER